MFYRTWAFGSDAWGLTVIALLDPEEVPWSPSDFNSLAIRPAVAYWLLTNFDWPYERCGKAMTAMGGCSQPLVNFVGASLDRHDAESIMTRRGYALLRHFAARGEPLNGYHNGLAPVHEAVLYADVGYLRALLELGADPSLPIDSPGRTIMALTLLSLRCFWNPGTPNFIRPFGQSLKLKGARRDRSTG